MNNAPKKQIPKAAPAVKRSRFATRKFRYGALATTFTVLFIAAILLLNGIVSAIDSKYPLYLDMTKDDLFTVTDESVEMIRARFDEWKQETGKDAQIKITFLAPRDKIVERRDYSWVITLAESYANALPEIEIEYREDLLTHPENYADYTRLGEPLSSTSIILTNDSSKASYQIFTFDSCMVYTEDGSSVWAFKGEMKFNAALLKITGNYSPVVAFTTGHGESRPENLLEVFYSCGFRYVDVDLAVEDIPEDTKILVISNPVKDFLSSENDSVKTECSRLNDYLNNWKGSVIISLAPPQNGTVEELKNLYEIIEDWGKMRVNRNALIQDDSYCVPGNNTMLYVSYTDTEGVAAALTETLASRTTPPRTLSYFSAPIEVLDEGDGDTFSCEPVLVTSENAYIEISGENGALETRSGPFATMAIASRFTYLKNEGTYSHMLVIGTDSFSETTAFRGQFGNTEILFNTIRLMTKENIAVTQSYKVLEDYSLSMETGSMYTFGIITVIAVPLVIFTLGIVVYIKRKHL